MTITINGDLILEKDESVFEDSIEVKGNIISKDYKRDIKVIGDINARNIDARNIDAWDINARNIDAWDINAWDINAWDINANARDIDAWDINARNIDARNIDAWDINAGNINARNINYYAICFAYEDIKCKSIKGRRNNCKHFVLDGEIIIKDVLKEEGK